jgi:voltage-gated potassium channel
VNERAEHIRRRFDVPILVAASLVIPVIVVEQSVKSEPWTTASIALNWLIWTTFATEMVVTTIAADKRSEWLRRHPLELAVTVLTVPLLPALLQGTRALRLVQLLRVLWLARFMQALRRLFTFEGLRYGALLALMTALGGGAAFAAVEGLSAWDGVYWAVTTMTTVGYGDVTPATDGGRLIAIFVMVVGIGFLTMVIGAVSQRFVTPELQEAAVTEQEIATTEAEMLGELREIMTRLRRLEASVQRIGASSSTAQTAPGFLLLLHERGELGDVTPAADRAIPHADASSDLGHRHVEPEVPRCASLRG